jgi:hypothetical protein
MSAGPSLADENAPGWPRRVAARAYVASRLGLSTGNMALLGRRDGGASMLRGAALRVRGRRPKGHFPPVDLESIAGLRRFAAQRTLSARRRRRSVRRAVLVRHPSLAIDRHHGEVVVRVVAASPAVRSPISR